MITVRVRTPSAGQLVRAATGKGAAVVAGDDGSVEGRGMNAEPGDDNWSAWPQFLVTLIWAIVLAGLGGCLFRERDARAPADRRPVRPGLTGAGRHSRPGS